MGILKGRDSAVPQLDHLGDAEVWGIYVAGDTPHVWTHKEVAELGAHGIKAVLPIVVPNQAEDWWTLNDGYAYLESLVREALAWGIPASSPLVLDLEEAQAQKLPQGAYRFWAVACRSHDLVPWTYLPMSEVERDLWCNRWAAAWPTDVPTDPKMPPNCVGWQYAGAQEGDTVDYDIFEDAHEYLTPTLEVQIVTAGVNGATSSPKDPAPQGPAPVVTAEVTKAEQDLQKAVEEVTAAEPHERAAVLAELRDITSSLDATHVRLANLIGRL